MTDRSQRRLQNTRLNVEKLCKTQQEARRLEKHIFEDQRICVQYLKLDAHSRESQREFG
jgi:hypothetical protein